MSAPLTPEQVATLDIIADCSGGLLNAALARLRWLEAECERLRTDPTPCWSEPDYRAVYTDRLVKAEAECERLDEDKWLLAKVITKLVDTKAKAEAVCRAAAPFAEQARIIDANEEEDGNRVEDVTLFRLWQSLTAISVGDCRAIAAALAEWKAVASGSAAGTTEDKT